LATSLDEHAAHSFFLGWSMFGACRRRQASVLQGESFSARAAEVGIQWRLLACALLRLAFKRRLWAHLGRWLGATKNGVRLQTELADWWTAL